MRLSVSKEPPKNLGDNIVWALTALTALLATFLASNLHQTLPTKSLIFVFIIFFYFSFCAVFYLRRRREIAVAPGQADTLFTEEIETKLFALEEAHLFFGSSLKSADMFRLVASRLKEIVPFDACAIFIADQQKTTLRSPFAVGLNAARFRDLKLKINDGLAGKTFQSGKAQIEDRLTADVISFSAKVTENLNSGIAVPLRCGAEVFGVLVLYGEREKQFDSNSLKLLEASATRVAPLFLSSQSFENTLTNALTDAPTSLPNERAFYMVLENQIAESQRFRDERPLTVVAFDVEHYDEVRERFGPAAGDLLLGFVAETIKNQLRQMDFLARSGSDEFFVVLPNASAETSKEILERVRKTFVVNPFKSALPEKIYLQLNFGAASFGSDGETANSLVKHARLRKQQSKSAESAQKILWFPREFIN